MASSTKAKKEVATIVYESTLVQPNDPRRKPAGVLPLALVEASHQLRIMGSIAGDAAARAGGGAGPFFF